MKTIYLVLIILSLQTVDLYTGSFISFPEKESIYRLDTLDKVKFSNLVQQEFWEYYQSQELCSKIEIYDSLSKAYKNGLEKVLDFSIVPRDIIIDNYKYISLMVKNEFNISQTYNKVKLSIQQFDSNFVYNEIINISVIYKNNGYGKKKDTLDRSTSIFYWMYLSIYKEIEIDIILDIFFQGYIYRNEQYFVYLDERDQEFIKVLKEYGECE